MKTPDTIAQECWNKALSALEDNCCGDCTESIRIIAAAIREATEQMKQERDDFEEAGFALGVERDTLRNEATRLAAEVERLKAQDEFQWGILKGCMDELEMVDMGPSMIRGEIREWKCSHGRLKAKEVAATDRAVLLAMERDQLRAEVERYKQDFRDQEKRIQAAHRELAQATGELNIKRQLLDRLRAGFDKLTITAAQTADRNVELRAEVERLRGEALAATDDASAQAKQKNEYRAALDVAEGTLKVYAKYEPFDNNAAQQALAHIAATKGTP